MVAGAGEPQTPDMNSAPAPSEHPASLVDRLGLNSLSSPVWRLALAIAVTVAAMLVAAEVGVVSAAFGLAGPALGLGVVLVVAGLLVRPQAMLPLGLVAAALTIPAAVTVLRQPPIDRSVGLLAVTPRSVSEIDGQILRRGLGTVFVDLRALVASDGRTLNVTAQADTGSVVVALPRDRCFRLRVTARRLEGADDVTQGSFDVLGRRLGSGPTVVAADISANFSSPPGAAFDYLTPRFVAFGRAVAGDTYRRDGPAGAPTLNLHLAAGEQIVIRDYPDHVGPLTRDGVGDEQVGDINWPLGVRLPPRPDDIALQDRWHPEWTPAQITARVPQRWAQWQQRAIAAQQLQARRFPGVCATNRELASTWSTSYYGDETGAHAMSVNGLGRIEYWTLQGGVPLRSNVSPSNQAGAR